VSTNVYIDGFNVYYGLVKNTPYKWLDLGKVCSTLLPGIQLNRIRYFTAHVKPLPHDEQAPLRQNIYLRALKTIPNLHMHDNGHFVSWPRWMPEYPLVYPDPTQPPKMLRVLKGEEKKSDINMASYLLDDCFNNDFDEAVIISNDSDIVTPIELVTTKYRKNVKVINPQRRGRLSVHLQGVATSYINSINRSVLANCQFPPILRDSRGTFTKPAIW